MASPRSSRALSSGPRVRKVSSAAPAPSRRVVPSKQVFVIAGSEQSRSFPYVLSDQVETEGREQSRQFPRRNRLVRIAADPVPDVVEEIHAALPLVTGDMRAQAFP